jgi:uncharacterized iron-regulated membrane protein
MTFWDRWMLRPQSLWLRKALFQIHLWTGIGLGLYVVLISVSGSAIVFRNELYKTSSQGPTIVRVSGPKLSRDALKQAVRKAWPKYSVSYIWEAKHDNEATEVWIEKDGQKNAKSKGRLFDPYTGEDLGSSRPWVIGVVAWFMDLHTNLLGKETGRNINGWLSIFVVILSLTGVAIWWPGKGRVGRSLKIDFRANWKRLNWDMHSVVGLWMFAFVFIWGVTGVFVVFPAPFQRMVNHFSPLEYYKLVSEVDAPVAGAAIVRVADPPATPRTEQPPVRRRRPPIRRSPGDNFLRWLYYLHFGNFAGWQVKALWVVLGLAPVFLFVTGALMWWNRVLSREARALRQRNVATPRVA